MQYPRHCKIMLSQFLLHWHHPVFSSPSPDDFRIFVGDLGNDVNDDLLARTFSKYPTFLKARVIRDKWTKKTKGYGFVSFKDPHDFIQAMREMNGQCSMQISLVFVCVCVWESLKIAQHNLLH